MNLPVPYKEWFLNRMVKEINKSREEGNGANRSAHQNDYQSRALQGMTNPNAPSRLRRFT